MDACIGFMVWFGWLSSPRSRGFLYELEIMGWRDTFVRGKIVEWWKGKRTAGSLHIVLWHLYIWIGFSSRPITHLNLSIVYGVCVSMFVCNAHHVGEATFLGVSTGLEFPPNLIPNAYGPDSQCLTVVDTTTFERWKRKRTERY